MSDLRAGEVSARATRDVIVARLESYFPDRHAPEEECVDCATVEDMLRVVRESPLQIRG